MRARTRSVLSATLIAITLPAATFAQTTPQCDLPDAVVRSLEAKVAQWRQQEFDGFRRRLVNADLAGATPASEPLVVTGGLNESKTTAKMLVSKGFAGAGTAAVEGALTSEDATAIDVFDPLKAATDYSAKFSLGWSHWKNVLPAAKLRAEACRQAAQFRVPGEAAAAQSAMAASLRPQVTFENPLVLGGSYEVGRSTFDFADPANDYNKASERHKAQALNATGGFVVLHGKATDGIRPISTVLATYQRRWGYTAGADTAEFVCHPVEHSTASTCGTDALPNAPPKSKPGNLLQIDARHFLRWPIAPGLRFTRNFIAGFNTIEAPVYFIAKSDSKDDRFSFIGGVTAGYRDGGSAKGRFVAVFFGTTARPAPKS